MSGFWLGFALLILILLVVDLGVYTRKARVVSAGEALAWTIFWVALALAFNFFVYWAYEGHVFGIGLNGAATLSGSAAAWQFFTVFLLEKSLSIDHLFVLAAIFASAGVPAKGQQRVLIWGLLVALLLRAGLVLAGVALVQWSAIVEWLLGLLLLATAVKLLLRRKTKVDPSQYRSVRMLRRMLPVAEKFSGGRLLYRSAGKWIATPLLPVLLLVVNADLVFALDAIPAALAVCREPFLIYTANAFALLGLRSLYFALAAWMGRLRYLRRALVGVLVFASGKLLLGRLFDLSPQASLGVILIILVVGVSATLIRGGHDPDPLDSPLQEEVTRLQKLTLRHARRVGVVLGGGGLLVIGAALLFLPGPGIPILLAGLALLATEFLWARRWFCLLREKFGLKPCAPDKKDEKA